MIHICMPAGDYYGWAVCGKYITTELSKLTDVRYVEGPFDKVRSIAQDPITSRHFRDISLNGGFPDIVLQALKPDFTMPMPNLKGKVNAGYTFFETEKLSDEFVRNAKQHDIVIAGSTWCADILKQYDIKTEVIVQGIDPVLFHSGYAEKQMLKDKFVIFSGGKFEQRKGQDIVLNAFKHLSDKYDDMLLVAMWYDLFYEGDFWKLMQDNLKQFDINPDKVIFLPPEPHYCMPHAFQNTDIGLFPNRVEGGTNLVMQEYMACGKPVVATYLTGHIDVLDSTHAVSMEAATIDDAVDAIESARNNMQIMKQWGVENAVIMGSKFTWKHTAERFDTCLTKLL